jgi:hypothetical protein
MAEESLLFRSTVLPGYQPQPLANADIDAMLALDQSNFTATKPDTNKRMLKIKKESVAKLLEFDATKKQMEEKIRQWNLKHNSDGDLWEEELTPNKKRRAEEAEEDEASAKSIPRKPEDLQDRKSPEATAADLQFQNAGLDGLEACLHGGHGFLSSLTDMCAKTTKPLCQLGFGTWLEKSGASNALTNRKAGDWLIPFKVVDDDQLFVFTCKPEFEGKDPFPTSRQPLHKFLEYLEENGVTDASLAAHAPFQRSEVGERKKYATNALYDVLFQPQKNKKGDIVCWAYQIPQEKFETSEHVEIVIGLEFVKKFSNTIVPALPYLFLKKPVRFIKDEMYRLTG